MPCDPSDVTWLGAARNHYHCAASHRGISLHEEEPLLPLLWYSNQVEERNWLKANLEDWSEKSALHVVLSALEPYICYYLGVFFPLILEVPFLIGNYAPSSSGIHDVKIWPFVNSLLFYNIINVWNLFKNTDIVSPTCYTNICGLRLGEADFIRFINFILLRFWFITLSYSWLFLWLLIVYDVLRQFPSATLILIMHY